MKRGKEAFVLIFLFAGTSLFALEIGVWSLQTPKDKFGDPTGEKFYVQAVLGEGKNSIGSTSTQVVGISYPVSNQVAIGLASISTFSMPLNMLFMGPEPITLYIKDSANKTYSFGGTQTSSDGGVVVIAMHNDSDLIGLLRKKGSYKAVIEGGQWSCSFNFNGGMPQ
jgi:hypothetical protein